MATFMKSIALDQPAVYEFKVQGRVNGDLSDWFRGDYVLRVECPDPDLTITILTGWVLDQAGLHGLLTRIRDLGLTLLFVDCLSSHERQFQTSELSALKGDEKK